MLVIKVHKINVVIKKITNGYFGLGIVLKINS
ncbi:hypothetical protein DJ87_3937 [Bacillus cereus]|nr:hypothetical protein II7_05158 [Bacillus cereus MSX-A12]KFK71214.1 hypothetical protein DJ87_3937 [Bacillus cereus]SMD93789.1 hypothetical protein BACERE00183_00757 [Bacillus cereus]